MHNIKATLWVMLAGLLCLPGMAFAADSWPQQEFIVNISGNMPEWRAHKAYEADEAQIFTAVYEGLFVYDPYNLDPIPALAESWVLSGDGLEWKFRIRTGAKFSNGDPITAQDIRSSWLALLDPELAAPYASLLDPITGVADFRSGKTRDPSLVGILTPDAQTLVVKLVTPAPQLPKILCHHAFSAIHPSDLAQNKARTVAAGFSPISSGAFVVSSVSPTEVMLTKNPLYWDADKVLLPSIKLLISNDATGLTSRYNLGEIHWLAGSAVIDKVLDTSTLHVTPMFSTEYFFFRTTWGPWADPKVRNALLLAVPWKDFRANYLIPAKTLVFPIAGYPQLDGIGTQNVEQAKKMLAEAGIADPATIEPIVISIPESQAFDKLAQILETSWKAIGLKVTIRSIPYDNYYKSLKANDYSLGVTSWIGDFADPLSFLELFRPTSSLNDSGWNNPAFEKLITDAGSIKQSKDRYAKLAEAEKLLLADGVILPVAHNPSLNVIDTNGISGWYPNALDIHPFKFIRFSQKKTLPNVASRRAPASLASVQKTDIPQTGNP
jgi:oligopeptide transport system substrate-binding protein